MRVLGITLLFLVNIGLFSLQTVFASSASFYYSDGPWSGRVIDSEEKGPIEGAVVVAVWRKVYATPAGDNSYFHDAVEVLTDKDGKFIIPKFRAFNIIPIIRRIEGPDFTIFKPGYTAFPGSSYNYFYKYFPNSPLRVNRDTRVELFKKGVVVELLRIKTKEERLEEQSGAYPLGGVPNEKMKYLLNLINKERLDLGLHPISVNKRR